MDTNVRWISSSKMNMYTETMIRAATRTECLLNEVSLVAAKVNVVGRLDVEDDDTLIIW